MWLLLKVFPMLKKWGTGLCPVLDLWDLNRHLRFLRFRRLTHTALLRIVCPGNWLTSVNLFSYTNTVYALHRKYLRCAFPGTTYVCMVLSLEISLSPQVFVKCTIAPSRKQGIRVATYVNWLRGLVGATGAQKHALAAHGELSAQSESGKEYPDSQ